MHKATYSSRKSFDDRQPALEPAICEATSAVHMPDTAVPSERSFTASVADIVRSGSGAVLLDRVNPLLHRPIRGVHLAPSNHLVILRFQYKVGLR